MRRPNSDDSYHPSFPDVPPSPAAFTPSSTSSFAENPFSDNNPFEDYQLSTVQAITPTIFAENEVIRRSFYPTRQDELTVNFGESVRILQTFDDGWAHVVKVPATGSDGNVDVPEGGTQGLIPIDCLREPGQDLPAFISAKRLSSYAAAEDMDDGM